MTTHVKIPVELAKALHAYLQDRGRFAAEMAAALEQATPADPPERPASGEAP